MKYVYELNEFNFSDENELLDNNNYITFRFYIKLNFIFEFSCILLI